MEKKRVALRKLLEAVEKEILKKPDKKTLDRLSLLVGFSRHFMVKPVPTRTTNKKEAPS